MLRKSAILTTVIMVAVAFAEAGYARDPGGSTPSAPRPSASGDPRPSAPTPSAIPLPDRGPTDLVVRPTLPPPEPIDDLTARDPQAAMDQQVDALLRSDRPDDRGFGLAAASDGDGTAASSANCWDNGAGCGPGGQPQFEANCHSQGGGLSSHDDDEGGTYVKCTLPPN